MSREVGKMNIWVEFWQNPNKKNNGSHAQMSKNMSILTGGTTDSIRQQNDFYPTPSASIQALIDTGVLDECSSQNLVLG